MSDPTAEPGKRKRKKSALLERVEYVLYRSVAAAARRMSDESLLRWGSRLGSFARNVLRGRDRLAMRNLRASFPEKSEPELRHIADECWRHFGREALSYLKAQTLSLADIVERTPFVNRHILDDAVAEGRGVMLISAHYGSWEIAGLAIMAALKTGVRTVARPLDNSLLERDLVQLRARTGAEVVDRRKAARVLMRGLAEKGVVVLLPDQAVQEREGVLVPFLGRPAWTTAAPARMAAHYGSTIVFGFCIPDGTRHRLEFIESIRVSELSGEERDAEALTARINDVISRRIVSRPELWLWMHDRWKGTGRGEHTDAQ